MCVCVCVCVRERERERERETCTTISTVVATPDATVATAPDIPETPEFPEATPSELPPSPDPTGYAVKVSAALHTIDMACDCGGPVGGVRFHLTESVCKVAFQKSIPTQIRQLILCTSNNKG